MQLPEAIQALQLLDAQLPPGAQYEEITIRPDVIRLRRGSKTLCVPLVEVSR